MISKKLLIIAAAIVIVAGLALVSCMKEDVKLDVHAEYINNTTEIYLVTKILDSNGSIVDTNFGKLTIEIQDKYGCTGVIYEEIPIEHGINVLRDYGGNEIINVHYDGGYFYNPCDYSGELIIKQSTNLSDEDLTSYF